ncbi:MAG: hypothetical protein QM270_07310 [Bacillota bacterium]|nr:hypothetical protein [Bacillota bacterium]
MTGLKAPRTCQEQVDNLKQRGCIVTGDETCIEKLAAINDYWLSAYFLPFEKQENPSSHVTLICFVVSSVS